MKNNDTSHKSTAVRQTWVLAHCYKVVGIGKRRTCEKTSKQVDPAARFTVGEPIRVRNGKGTKGLVPITFLNEGEWGKAGDTEIIWEGDLRNV